MKGFVSKKFLLCALIVVMLLTTILLCSCSFKQTPDKMEEDTITYDNIVFKDGTVTLKPNGHPMPSSYVPTKEGYTFLYWITDKIDKSSVFNQKKYDGKPIVLYAYWRPKTYTVKFVDYDGRTLLVNGKENQVVEYNSSATAPQEPTREGYTFVGWDCDFSQIKGELTVKATYERKKTEVTFYYGNEILTIQEIFVGEKLNSLESSAQTALKIYTENTGLEFFGWFTDMSFSNKIDITNETAQEDMSIYARLDVAHLKDLTIKTSNQDNAFDYSENLAVTATCSYTSYPDVDCSIKWYLGVEQVGEESKVKLQNLQVGEYDLTVTVTQTKDHSTVEDSATIKLTINKMSITVKANDVTIKYGDDLPTFTYTVKDKKGMDFGKATYVCQYVAGDSVGEYTITLQGLEHDFYRFIYEEGTMTVIPKQIVVNAVDTTIIYGDDVPAFEYTSSGLLQGDTLGEAEFTTTYEKGKNAGTYPIEVSGLSSENYLITEYKPATLTVEKKELSFTLECKTTLYYGDECSDSDFKYTVRGLLEGDELGTPRFQTNYTKGNDAGRYAVRMSMSTSNNYTYQTTITLYFYVLKRSVTLEWSYLDEYVYNGKDQGDTIGATFIDIDGNQANADIVFTNEKFQNAGQYLVTAVYANNNYTFTNSTKEFEIKKISADVKVDDMIITFGDDVPQYTYTVEGLIEGDSLGEMIFLCDYKKGSEQGLYKLIGSGLTNVNYDITYTNAVLTVQKRIVSAEWVYNSEPYVYNGDNQSKTIYAKFLDYNGRNVNLPLSYTLNGVTADFKVVGTYVVTATNTDPNYELINASKLFTINPKDVYVMFDTQTITFGDNPPTYTSQIVGMVVGEKSNKLGELQYVCDYKRGDDAGTYEITGKNLHNSNYNINYVSAILTVNKLFVNVEWDYPSTFTYNGQNQSDSVTARFVGYLGNYFDMDITYALGEYTTFNHAGTYRVTANSTHEKNYSFQKKVINLTIDKKEASILTNDVELVYGDEIPTYSAVVSGLVDGDKFEPFVFNCKYKKGSVVGAYTIEIKQFEVNDYKITFENATLTCLPRQVQVNWTFENSYVYNRQDQSDTVQAVFVDYDSANKNLFIDFGSPFINANTYNLVAYLDDDCKDNYILCDNLNTLTIVPKQVQVIVDDKTATFGDKTVDFTRQVSGIVDGDSIQMDYDFVYVQGKTNVGSYLVGINYEYNSNYNLTIQTGELTVYQKQVEVIWHIPACTYNGQNQSAQITCYYTLYDGKQKAMSITFGGTATTFKNAGTYTLLASDSDTNYEFINTQNTAQMDKKPLTIDVDNKSVIFGSNASFSYKITGLVKGDGIGDYRYVCDYTVGSGVNTYNISMENVVNANYDITINDGVLTVNQREVQAVWETSNRYVYNGQDQSSTVKCYYLDYMGGKVYMTLRGDTFKNAGEYTFTASYQDANYVVSNLAKSVTIEKADYTNVEHRDLTGTYSPTATLLNFDLDNGFNWFDASITPTVPQTKYKAVYNMDSQNYNDYNLYINLVLTKATHQNVESHPSFSGVYSPTKSLGDYVLLDNYYWVTSTTIPTVNVTQYNAYFNSDRDNYFDYSLQITLTLSKANYQGITHKTLSGVYNPTSTLSNYTLSKGFRWTDSAITPTVDVKEYSAIYNGDSVNYNDFALKITLNLSKANYTSITHTPLSGTYDKDKTLSNYTLDAYFSWLNPTSVPTCNVTSYKAKYNADPTNYNDYSLNITLTLAKAQYTNITHKALTGTYDKGKTLASYKLDAGFYWVDSTITPTVSQTTYAAYYNADIVNYQNFDLTITLTLDKATYEGITHRSLTVTYSEGLTLGDILLDKYFSWVDPTIQPTIEVTTYQAIYNADPENYYTYELTITLVLREETPTIEKEN